MDLKTFLILSGMLATGYTAYNFIGKKTKITSLPLETTRRISQQIKHQVMIVCIPYSQAMAKIRMENSQKIKQHGEAVMLQFRGEMSQIYTQKQNLIIKKYLVSKQTYGASLQNHKKDKTIAKIVTEIMDMLERSMLGLAPDFTIPREAENCHTKEQLCTIYKQMVTEIGKKVQRKLREEQLKNKNFDPASDEDFRRAVRELSIYDVKITFLKGKGFKSEWGCPNEVFFKHLESHKAKDLLFNQRVVAYEKTYEKVIEVVSADPSDLDDDKIEKMFNDVGKEVKPVNIPTGGRNAALRPQPAVLKKFEVPVESKPPAPVENENEDENDIDIEAMMMNELISRSQNKEEPVSAVQQPQIVQSVEIVTSQSNQKRLIQVEESVEVSVPVQLAKPENEAVLEKPEVDDGVQSQQNQNENQEQEQEREPIVEAEPIVEEEPIAVEAEPIAVEAEPIAVEAEPIAVEAEPIAVEAEPIAVEAEPIAVEAEPIAVEAEPIAVEAEPIAVEAEPIAVEAEPIAVEADIDSKVKPEEPAQEREDQGEENKEESAEIPSYHNQIHD